VLRPQPGYPFTLELRVEYSLSPGGLGVRTTATNASGDACPYGAGAHPYLAVGAGVDEAVLRLPAEAVLEADERGIPVGSAPVEGTELDFRKPRSVGPARLDHCFTDLDRGEDGRVRVEIDKTALWADESYPYLMIFTGDGLPDADRTSLAVEPMTCAPNAFASGDGLIVLEPGESHAAAWGISPRPGD
jgi:aldose 1-epimerase